MLTKNEETKESYQYYENQYQQQVDYYGAETNQPQLSNEPDNA